MSSTGRGRLAVDIGGAWRIYWGPSPLPAGAEALGTVARGAGDTGALLRLATGYVQGNARVLRALDQRKAQAAIDAAEPRRGGARAGGGRPTGDGATGVVRKNVTLDERSIEALRELGDGDLSLGIRRAASRIA